MSTEAWKTQSERSTPSMLNFIIWVALTLGRPAARALLPPIVFYFCLTSRATRLASRNFLSRVLTRPPVFGDIYKHVHTFAACTLDRVFLMAHRLRGLQVRVVDPSTMLRARPGEPGCLTLVSHVGSFDVMRVLGAERKQLDFRILMDRAHGAMLQTALERLNPHFASEIIDAGMGGPALVLAMKEAIQKGNMIGVMADRIRAGEPFVEVDFLGGRARLPAAPWLFAAALKVPVQLCFGIYRGGARYDLHFEQFTEPLNLPRGDRSAALQRLAQGYADRLAHYARCAPYNWFNFFDYWSHDAAAG
jgi:predicted LPLAT superfamily acyltransferase